MKVKVLVVDDSAFMRKVISDIINSDPQMTVVGTARNGQDAIDKVQKLQPNVVTLDVEMPIMDGLKALEEIMKTKPTPVVMLSSQTKNGAEATLGALQRGAIDFITKPSGSISLDIHKLEAEIRLKVKIAAMARIPRVSRGSPLTGKGQSTSELKLKRPSRTPESLIIRSEKTVLSPGLSKNQVVRPASIKLVDSRAEIENKAVIKPSLISSTLNRLVMIGTSTGGPRALYEIIPALPAHLGAPVLVVQHMPPGFTRSLAERLDAVSAIRVKEAEDGEEVVSGTVYIAPGDYHLTVRPRRGENEAGQRLFIELTRDPLVSGHRPSVDVMMTSVANCFWAPMVAVILTGMGQDGTQGMKFLKSRGCRTIAEDESTCVVFGMPRVAIESGIVDRVVPLPRIATEIQALLR